MRKAPHYQNVDQTHRRFGVPRDLHIAMIHLRLGQAIDGCEQNWKFCRATASHHSIDRQYGYRCLSFARGNQTDDLMGITT